MVVAEDIIRIGNYYYFAARGIYAICRLKADSDVIETVYSGSSEELCNHRMYGRVFEYKNQLYFPPLNAKSILVFDLLTEKTDFIDIGSIEGCVGDYFLAGLIVGNALYLVGCQYPAIVKCDLMTKEVTYYEEPYKELIKYHSQDGDCYFRADVAFVDNCIYAASCLCNRVLEFSTIDNSYRWHEVGNEDDGFSGITWDGNKFWLSSRHKAKVTIWNPIENSAHEIEIPINETDELNGSCSFLGAVFDGVNIILPGMNLRKTVVFKADDANDMYCLGKRFTFYTLRENYIYGQDENNDLLIYEKTDLQNPKRIIRTKNDNEILINTIKDGGTVVNEGFCGLGLETFIKSL